MNISDKVDLVNNLFDKLEDDISKFKHEYKLDCIKGCYQCCLKPDIEATVLEFLPLALHLYKTGKHIEVLERLEQLEENSLCIGLNINNIEEQNGGCSIYPYRGLICRLFGFSAVTDKNDKNIISTCKIIKTELSEDFQKADSEVKNGADIPVIKNYYMELYGIDPNLATNYYQINSAIRRAIELVAMRMEYEEG
jgi:Fe-S-cluster containining protein